MTTFVKKISESLLGKNVEVNLSDRIFFNGLKLVAYTFFGVLSSIVLILVFSSADAFKEFGFSFITSMKWNPVAMEYGALPFIYGTMITSILALAISTPPCIALALFNTQISPHRLRSTFSFLIEMLAGIPSIVYGMWALFILAPFVREYLYPISQILFPGFILFKGPSFGIGILTASLVLAIMISPIIASMTTEVFKAIHPHQKYAALALGATKWEMYKISILKEGKTGILGAMTLGLGRALGETMAVAMVIGNNAEIKASLFSAGATMASVMANEYAEALDDVHLSTLNYIALLLFAVSFSINFFAKVIIEKAYDGRK